MDLLNGFYGRFNMRTLIAIGFICLVLAVIVAGRAVDSFAASIDTSNGFAGSAYSANP